MNSLDVVLSPEGLPGTERSEGERSEPKCSAAPGKVGAELRSAARPDPELVAKAKPRTYTAEYKQRILQEAEAASATRGGVGALLRREGLYSSLLCIWRRGRDQGMREALSALKRGPKSRRNPLEEENLNLRKQVGRLTEKLRKAEIIIDVQKKVAALLGQPAALCEVESRRLRGEDPRLLRRRRVAAKDGV